jgi:hypothetical protein
MIDCPPWSSVRPNRVRSGLTVIGCRVDLVLDDATDRVGISAEAARLAEDLVAARIGCEPRLVRVAALMPSGRPVALVRGRAATISVSVSHGGGLFGAAVCGTAGVGLDIVDPAEAGPSLDAWFSADEIALLSDDDGLLRARLWGAKESAFKAAGFDEGFRPRSVAIEHLGPTGFRWSARGVHGRARGQGVFADAGRHLVAVAVAAGFTTTQRQARSR